MLKALYALVLVLVLLLCSCEKQPQTANDTEVIAAYDWMAGESPVSNRRIGVVRAGVNLVNYAVSPTGIYIDPEVVAENDGQNQVLEASYIWYADHGDDKFRKLCGRTDCTHDNEDCNAYIYKGSNLSYYQGKLYVMAGGGYPSEICKLYRMEPDGSQRRVLLDLNEFAENNHADFSACNIINNGYCIFSLYVWQENGAGGADAQWLASYKYKLDGTGGEPQQLKDMGVLYQCGDIFLGLTQVVNEDLTLEYYTAVDLEAGNQSYLTKSPGVPGWFGDQEGYYFKDGTIVRLDYVSQKENVMVDTGLEGDYYAFCFPDCIVLASCANGDEKDDNLYFYNWDYELVDVVRLTFSYMCSTDLTIMAETADKIILTDGMTPDVYPLYYINKAELGTENVQLHPFRY